MKRRWYSTLEDLREECGECDYTHFDTPLHAIQHLGEDTFEYTVNMTVPPENEIKEAMGYTYYPAIDEFVPDNCSEDGIFVPESVLEEFEEGEASEE